MSIRLESGRKNEIIDAEFEEIPETGYAGEAKHQGWWARRSPFVRVIFVCLIAFFAISILAPEEQGQGVAEQFKAQQEGNALNTEAGDAVGEGGSLDEFDNRDEPPAPPNTLALIYGGSGKACVQQDVQDLILSAIAPKTVYGGLVSPRLIQIAVKAVHISIDMIAVGGHDETIPAILCTANVNFHVENPIVSAMSYGHTEAITYMLRPRADENGFILNGDFEEAQEFAQDAATGIAGMVLSSDSGKPRDTDSQSNASAAEN